MMKTLLLLLFSFAAASAFAAAGLENFCPHFATNMPIVWQATNQWPDSFWIYQRLPPRPFSATVISNAMILASLQSRKFPKPSTNDFYIEEDKPKWPNYPKGAQLVGATFNIF